MKLSIVIPTLDEAAGIVDQLTALQPLRREGHEVIVVDGGSTDATVELARPLADLVLATSRGRSLQMNAGAAQARSEVLLFLHADTRLPNRGLAEIAAALSTADCHWGRFDVTIEGRHPMLRVVASLMNLRSRLTGIATGDQAVFVRRGAFERVGGFPTIALMEDIALSAALKRVSRPACLRARVTTSGRRWEKHGVGRTIVKMWRLRLAYFLGAEPARLARAYTSHES
jgi:rSAM/selenodomain-associated transferase 2